MQSRYEKSALAVARSTGATQGRQQAAAALTTGDSLTGF